MNLKKQGVVKQGYLTKSPPLKGFISRSSSFGWYQRWFVLYDEGIIHGSVSDEDCDRLLLYYFESQEAYELGLEPKGKSVTVPSILSSESHKYIFGDTNLLILFSFNQKLSHGWLVSNV